MFTAYYASIATEAGCYVSSRGLFAVVGLTVALYGSVTPALAWDCKVPANKHLPECGGQPAPTPKPKHHYEKPAPTPVPEVPAAPTPAPTVASAPPAPAQPAAPAPPAIVEQTGAPIGLSEYCQKQPNGTWEIRRTSDSSPGSMGPLPVAPHVCAQSTPLPTATPQALISIPAAVPTATLYAPVQPPAEDTMPPEGPAPTPPATDQPPTEEAPPEVVMPPVQIPQRLPEAGGDDGCSYYETCLED